MRKGWIVALVAVLVLVGAYAVFSSPLFNKPSDVGGQGQLRYDLSYSNGQFTLVVTNPTNETQKLEFMTGEHLRVIVKDGNNVVFNSAEGMVFTQAINYAELEPGEQTTYQVAWKDAQKGTYKALAYLLAVSDDDPVATMDLTID